MGLLSFLFAVAFGYADRAAHVAVQPVVQSPSGRRAQSPGLWERVGGWLRRVLGGALRHVGVPRHIALILDGNRRFALKQGLAKARGHAFGFDKLHEALEWGYEVGVQTVTVFAFSIDNFRRPRDEVDTLMALAQEKLDYLLHESAVVSARQVRICVLGDTQLLPPALRATVDRVVRATAAHTGPRLNLCFPYTSTHEMVSAARTVAASGNDVTVPRFEQALSTGSDFPQLLLRTSGETRLSDFLCWQTGHAHFAVLDCLWPEFSWRDFYWALLQYQLERLRGSSEA